MEGTRVGNEIIYILSNPKEVDLMNKTYTDQFEKANIPNVVKSLNENVKSVLNSIPEFKGYSSKFSPRKFTFIKKMFHYIQNPENIQVFIKERNTVYLDNISKEFPRKK
ncbi:hypothetical protein ACTFIY_006176 [Dictyostelium cf. discoideum]